MINNKSRKSKFTKIMTILFVKESVQRRLKELKITFANKSSNEWIGRLPVVKESRQSTSTL